ncbi:hypothetical protein O988_03894 [Pseudogymnoascus sp. VKM F-3808]|nr:hypothetical protein O988_03894 [Pseudogymnoascus sp. VKM F-3808]
MELLIVASISIIVLDIIRYEVLEGKDGLPFGLLGSYFAFKSISFLASSGLLYGSRAISTWRRQLLLPVVLVLSCLLATLAGPLAALLMIPTTREFTALPWLIKVSTKGGRDDEKMHPVYNSVLKGDSANIYNPLYLDASNGTKKHWSMTVSGHAYSVNGKAYSYYLAFAALLLHAAMAITHIIVHLMWFKGSMLNAWTTFEGLMALSHNSRPNHEAMKNTSSGIQSRTTLARKVKVRVAKSAEKDEEQVQLLLDVEIDDASEVVDDLEDGGDGERCDHPKVEEAPNNDVWYTMVRRGKEYGAANRPPHRLPTSDTDK